MYEDYKGTITIDTVDHIITIDDYAKHFNIDTEKYKVLEIEIIRINLSNEETCYFTIQSKKDAKNIEKVKFSPNKSIFSDFFKTAKIIIKNK